MAVAALRPLDASVVDGCPQHASAAIAAAEPDPRVGLKAGLMDAGEATWNLKVLSKTPPSEKFVGEHQLRPRLHRQLRHPGQLQRLPGLGHLEPGASRAQDRRTSARRRRATSRSTRTCCSCRARDSRAGSTAATEGVKDTVSKDRLRGVRIFDITDIAHPKNVGNVQTCRGSHTHTVLVDPKDTDNVYVYISGSAGVRSPSELAGCVERDARRGPELGAVPDRGDQGAAGASGAGRDRELAAHLQRPRRAAEARRGAGGHRRGQAGGRRRAGARRVHRDDPRPGAWCCRDEFVEAACSTASSRRAAARGAPTAADSAALRAALPGIDRQAGRRPARAARTPGPTQCHDITVYPAIGLAGGACEGYGLLLDISDPAHPMRIGAVADSNFSYWHSATFNNDGTKLLFSDEWGGGGAAEVPRDRQEGVGRRRDLHARPNGKMHVPELLQAARRRRRRQENCVAHNGSLIPIPGRDVMVQAWYQGGISVFDWTDAAHPKEIAFFDRGPVDSTQMAMGGSWSVYWYNGVIVSSEIARGLDIFELTPSAFISQNEIDAAKTVHLDYLNTQGQPKFVWPASFALARAYVDQLERNERSRGGQAVGRARRAHGGREAVRRSAQGGTDRARHQAPCRRPRRA